MKPSQKTKSTAYYRLGERVFTFVGFRSLTVLLKKYKITTGIVLIVTSIIFSIWLCFWVMLYGGIMQAVENFQVNNSAVVWGIIRAILSGAGMIPAYIGIVIGLTLIEY